jgi:hypothetical protein
MISDSFYRKDFAVKRAGQYALQGFHFVPSAVPGCLGDTHLLSFHRSFRSGPVDTIPE